MPNASQDFSKGIYSFDSQDHLKVKFDASTIGEVLVSSNSSDQAAVFETFRISFTTTQDMFLSFSASVNATNTAPTPGAIVDQNSDNRSATIQLIVDHSAASSFTNILLFDNGSISTNQILAAGSYHLVTMSNYFVNAEPGDSKRGGTGYKVNFDLSATQQSTGVPEPHAALLLVALPCIAWVGKRRSAKQLSTGIALASR